MALAMFAVCKRVRLSMGDMSIVLCTLGGALSMEGNLYRVQRAIVFLDLWWVFVLLVCPVALE